MFKSALYRFQPYSFLSLYVAVKPGHAPQMTLCDHNGSAGLCDFAMSDSSRKLWLEYFNEHLCQFDGECTTFATPHGALEHLPFFKGA